MNYSKDEFFDLMEQAESQGAVQLDEVCAPRTYNFVGKALPRTINGCGHPALFDIPYESIVHDATDSRHTACAVDDDMGRWPRFGGDRFGREKEADA